MIIAWFASILLQSNSGIDTCFSVIVIFGSLLIVVEVNSLPFCVLLLPLLLYDDTTGTPNTLAYSIDQRPMFSDDDIIPSNRSMSTIDSPLPKLTLYCCTVRYLHRSNTSLKQHFANMGNSLINRLFIQTYKYCCRFA